MSHIIEFPTQQIRDWATIERALVPTLRKADMPQEAQTELLARMKSFTELLQMQFAFSIPAGCPDEVNSEIDRFAIALHERSNRLIMERLYREIGILKISGLL